MNIKTEIYALLCFHDTEPGLIPQRSIQSLFFAFSSTIPFNESVFYIFMGVYTWQKTYQTRKHLGMIDITPDFQTAVDQSGLANGIVTGFTKGVSSALTSLEFEPGLTSYDLKASLDIISPFKDAKGNVIPYEHHKTWGCDNGSSHIKAAILSPFITVPFVAGQLTLGPWQNFALVECDTRDREREVVYQVIGE
jgi:secondary thiamine-phosphate synthase enzyme